VLWNETDRAGRISDAIVECNDVRRFLIARSVACRPILLDKRSTAGTVE
jgi:hypothetical protein